MMPPAQHVHTEPAIRRIIYEQPLNERMRTFLRLDFLYQQLVHHAEQHSSWSSRAAVRSLLDILAILSRGDVRSEVLKELERRHAKLNAYRSKPGVDGARLQTLLNDLGLLRNALSTQSSQLVQQLRDNEFLNSIKHRSTIPGGTCDFDLPDYAFWLHRAHELRAQSLEGWLEGIRPVCEGVTQLLWLARESSDPQKEIASKGMFQLSLERGAGFQILRVGLPLGSTLYPEISGGQHRCTIRFLNWIDTDARPVQANEDVPFELSCC